MSNAMDQPGTISTIGIVGEGKMGTGLFYYLLDFPYRLAWMCSPSADLEKLRKTYGKRINRSLGAGIITPERFEILQQTAISADPAILSGCDLVIEAIPENPELKRALFRQISAHTAPGAILASNSSSIDPSEMIVDGINAENFIGMHFFYPVQLKNIVELIVTQKTSGETIRKASAFLDSVNRRYLLLEEKNSFILNRLFLDIQNEAFRLVTGGAATMRQTDLVVKEFLTPAGIFEFMDSVGLDTMLASILNYTRDNPGSEHYQPLIDKLTSLVAEGKLGQKSGEGFYRHDIPAPPEEPCANHAQIREHLYFTWITASKRFTVQSKLPIGDMNDAIREYLGSEKGPFE